MNVNCLSKRRKVACSGRSGAIRKLVYKTWSNEKLKSAKSLEKAKKNVKFVQKPTLCQELDDIGLPGFRKVYCEKCSRSGRIVWLLICILVVSACVYQCGERIQFYFNGPPSVYTEYVHNRTINFPTITVCPTNVNATNPAAWPTLVNELTGDNLSYSDSFDLVRQTGMNVSTLWNISKIQVKNLKYALSKGVSLHEGYTKSNENVELRIVPTTSGTCFSLVPKNKLIHNGLFTYVNIHSEGPLLLENKHMMWRYMAHLEEDIPLIRYIIPFQGLHSMFKFETHTAFRIEETVWLNTWKNPCEENKRRTSCVVKCLQELILNSAESKCRLPYMSEDANTFPQCEKPEEFMDVFSATNKILGNFHAEYNCSCRRKCRDTSFTLEMITERPCDEESLFKLTVYIPDNRIQIIKEQKIYNSVALFSDIGGGIGLFLGICTFHLLELLDIIVTRIRRSCRKPCRNPIMKT